MACKAYAKFQDARVSEQEHIQIVTSTSRGHIQGDNHM
ncbi:ASCH domain-containing protein, partial [Salmonella enterica subsp. enterica serovar Typhimurium]|nr:ASCH domain-containing protein [Salmonella enterica subsp. enterica serovar Typhimurium]